MVYFLSCWLRQCKYCCLCEGYRTCMGKRIALNIHPTSHFQKLFLSSKLQHFLVIKGYCKHPFSLHPAWRWGENRGPRVTSLAVYHDVIFFHTGPVLTILNTSSIVGPFFWRCNVFVALLLFFSKWIQAGRLNAVTRQETLISLNAFLRRLLFFTVDVCRDGSYLAHLSWHDRSLFSMRIFAIAFLNKGSVKEISCRVKRLGQWGWRWHLQAKILPLLA